MPAPSPNADLRSPVFLDVAHLPPDTMDHRSPIWWGNLLLLFIETTMFALMVGAYFYLRGNFTSWPPPQSNRPFSAYHTTPDLFIPSIGLAVHLISLVPMILADRAALKLRCRPVQLALTLVIFLGLAAVGLRFREFSAFHFRWDDNAYGSVVWTIAGLHLLHLIVGTCELGIMLAWILVHGLDEKHARDIRVTATYWYWIVGMWIILWTILFPGPRFF